MRKLSLLVLGLSLATFAGCAEQPGKKDKKDDKKADADKDGKKDAKAEDKKDAKAEDKK